MMSGSIGDMGQRYSPSMFSFVRISRLCSIVLVSNPYDAIEVTSYEVGCYNVLF